MFSKLFEANHSLLVSGIDYSRAMVRDATTVNQKYIRENKLLLHEGSSDHLPFANSSFEKVFCINVAYFWDDPAMHLKEIHRVLKPGGKFYATIRSKESMEMMPFTKYGFTSYTTETWMMLMKENRFNFLETVHINEPAADFKGGSYEIRSFCMVSQKSEITDF